MRIVSYLHESRVRGGVLLHDTVFDLERLLRAAGTTPTTSVRDFLTVYGPELKAFSTDVAGLIDQNPDTRVGARSDVHLTTPVPEPTKVLCVGLNYKDHVAETGRVLPEYPDVFVKFATTLVGPEDEIQGADVSANLDYEGEVAVVIGRAARHVSENEALDHVAGLAPLNDISARDLQYRGTQWTAGKTVDRSTPWGPALVTLDEIGDPQTLELITRVNGVELQHSNTRHQIFPIARIVSYISSFLTLEPGDVIATGTPQGIGAKRTPPIWLKPGDTVEIDVERVGILSNRVAER
ncbi:MULTISPECIES: fumarylacetoacetate hydrolase family protein [unclassified Streptomyces]|uniref:fumarylacetoacetate hydrolase family protein n=1 Tax=unclassified Streptomyces TaxID=2593676 RepID=UPI00168B5217|nr:MULTISPECIES: fumarylacetoacetate hydrolase family protein [unclassified Streptomyces]MBD3007205.1 fumarylacetoacetate hydrolase family protein [Streptomyces sp. 5-10]